MLIHLVAGREGALNFSARLSRAEHSSVTVQGNTLLMDGMLESGKPGLDGMKYRVAMQLVPVTDQEIEEYKKYRGQVL